jgi:hypothetical protein|tara:strand:+ start:373 stop:741 length:369 start_codon:yes stop_codon:yes gene_type:complete
MSSWGPSIPMEHDSSSGFSMNSSIVSEINQNFRMLILTIPGERVMVPDFGVGIKRYLFSRYGEDVYTEIKTKILDQTSRYLPVISISNITFDDTDMDGNILGIAIYYSIPTLGVSDSIVVTT